MDEKRLYALMALAEEQQAAARAAVEALGRERVALAQAIAAIRDAGPGVQQAAAEAVRSSLNGAATVAIQSSQGAVQSAVRRLGDAAADATVASARLRADAAAVGRRVLWGALGAGAAVAVAIGVAGWAATWWARSELEQLHADRLRLEASVEQLVRRGGRVQLTDCGPQRRLCVAVDTAAGTYSRGSEQYMVIRGY